MFIERKIDFLFDLIELSGWRENIFFCLQSTNITLGYVSLYFSCINFHKIYFSIIEGLFLMSLWTDNSISIILTRKTVKYKQKQIFYKAFKHSKFL